MNGAYTHKGIVAGGHTGDQVARRAAAVDRVHQLLGERPMTAYDVAEQLGMRPRTVYGYLRQMQDEGFVRKTGQADAHGRDLWTQDASGVQADMSEHGRRAWIVPARQIGMQRHWMDEALFGPARGVAA